MDALIVIASLMVIGYIFARITVLDKNFVAEWQKFNKYEKWLNGSGIVSVWLTISLPISSIFLVIFTNYDGVGPLPTSLDTLMRIVLLSMSLTLYAATQDRTSDEYYQGPIPAEPKTVRSIFVFLASVSIVASVVFSKYYLIGMIIFVVLAIATELYTTRES